MDVFVSAPKVLYRHFKTVSKSMLNLEGQLSKTLLPSATIKPANKVVLATLKHLKDHNNIMIFTIRLSDLGKQD